MSGMPSAKRARVEDEEPIPPPIPMSAAPFTTPASAPAFNLPTADQVLERVARMSDSAAKLLLADIVNNNDEARRRFHLSALSSSAPSHDSDYSAGYNFMMQHLMNRPSPTPRARQRPDRLEENEFEDEIEEVRDVVYGEDRDDEPWNPMMACDMEEAVSDAISGVLSACTESSEEGTLAPMAINYDTKYDGLQALMQMAEALLEGKKKPRTASLMNYEPGQVARAMQDIIKSLKPVERAGILQTPMGVMLDDLAERMERWKEEYMEVASMLRSRT